MKYDNDIPSIMVKLNPGLNTHPRNFGKIWYGEDTKQLFDLLSDTYRYWGTFPEVSIRHQGVWKCPRYLK